MEQLRASRATQVHKACDLASTKTPDTRTKTLLGGRRGNTKAVVHHARPLMAFSHCHHTKAAYIKHMQQTHSTFSNANHKNNTLLHTFTYFCEAMATILNLPMAGTNRL